jgi:hypothetical protein
MAVAVAGCSGGGWGTATLVGLPGASVDSVIVDTTSWDGGTTSPTLNVELVQSNGVLGSAPACHLYQTNGTLTGTAVYVDFVGGNGQPVTPGTYPIRIPPQCAPSCMDAGVYVVFNITDWQNEGSTYTGTNLGDGVGGTATLTQLDSQTVAGTFNASFVDEEGGTSTLTGSFSGPFCTKQQ